MLPVFLGSCGGSWYARRRLGRPAGAAVGGAVVLGGPSLKLVRRAAKIQGRSGPFDPKGPDSIEDTP